MMGITQGFPWQYHTVSDQLMVVSRCHFFPLKRYRTIGQPISPGAVRRIAARKVQEDFADLKELELRALRSKVTN